MKNQVFFYVLWVFYPSGDVIGLLRLGDGRSVHRILPVFERAIGDVTLGTLWINRGSSNGWLVHFMENPNLGNLHIASYVLLGGFRFVIGVPNPPSH